MPGLAAVKSTAYRIGNALLPGLLMLLSMAGAIFPYDSTGSFSIQLLLTDSCNSARAVLAVSAIIMVILAAIVYAIGQVLGAETRARATVWATAMLTGGMIGVLIYALVPTIIATIMGSGIIIASGNPCGITVL